MSIYQNKTPIDPNEHVRQPFLSSACRIVLYRDHRDVCNVREHFDFDAFSDQIRVIDVIDVVFPCIGIVNSVLSLMVLCQPKHDNRLLPLLMRALYVCDLMLSTNMASYTVFNRYSDLSETHWWMKEVLKFQMFVIATMLKTAIELVALMTVVRYVYFKDPFNLRYNERRRKELIVGLMILVNFNGLTNFKFLLLPVTRALMENPEVNGFLFLAMVIVTVVFNVATSVHENRRIERLSRVPSLISVSNSFRRLSLYRFTSSCLAVLTIMPAVVVLLFPYLQGDFLDCDYCVAYWKRGLYMLNILTWNCYFDNYLYCFLWSDYQYELRSVLHRLFRWLRRKRSSMSIDLPFGHSQPHGEDPSQSVATFR